MYNCTTSRGPILISFLLDQSFFIIPPQSRKSVFSFWARALVPPAIFIPPCPSFKKRAHIFFSKKNTNRTTLQPGNSLSAWKLRIRGPLGKGKVIFQTIMTSASSCQSSGAFLKKPPTTGTGTLFRCVSTLSQGTWHVGVLGKSLQEVSWEVQVSSPKVSGT